MPIINFSKLVGENLQTELYDKDDWVEWRYCYAAGRLFRDEYLERFSDRESKKEFVRRSNLTPIPAYARLEINRVRNALTQRFPDIIRLGGNKAWREAVDGIGKGVDRRGSSMNSYMGKYLLPEALVMRRVGVLVDAPRVDGNTAADVPKDFRPYLNYYPVEHIERIIPASVDSPSDWSAVLVKDINRDYDIESGEVTDRHSYRYYYLDPSRGGRVTIRKYDHDRQESAAPRFTNLESIPFVLVDVLESLIKDVCSYQIAHLNLISADTSYAIDANYPILTRQRGNSIPAHLLGEDSDADVGTQKGLWYDRGLDRPDWISPDTAPINTGFMLRKGYRDEVRELVTSALAALGEDGSMEAGLAFIGQCLEDAESRIWDHWNAYYRSPPPGIQIIYPEDWSLKTDEERLEEADKYISLMNKLPGQKGKKQAAKMAYDRWLRGRIPMRELDAIKKEVDEAPYAISDPDVVIKAKKEGIFSVETSALALGANEDEAEKAKQDKKDTQQAIAAAQMDQQQGGPGNPDASVDSNSNAVARQGDSPEGVQGRGEGQDNEEDEE